MVVIVHETIGVADPVISLVDVLEGVQEVDPVLVALEDGLSFVAPGGEVVDCTGVFYAKRAGHNGRTVALDEVNVNSKDLTLRGSKRFSDPKRFGVFLCFWSWR